MPVSPEGGVGELEFGDAGAWVSHSLDKVDPHLGKTCQKPIAKITPFLFAAE